MLNRSKVMHKLRQASEKLFVDISPAFQTARDVWDTICQDPVFIHKVRQAQDKAPWLLPTWQGTLNEFCSNEKKIDSYRVLAIDGSQIYPDRHQGTSCYLINIGTVVLTYGLQGKSVVFDSQPSVFVNEEDDYEMQEASTEIVNCKRQELEFYEGIQASKQFYTDEVPFVFLFDGSLIFWHLESKDMQLKHTFLGRYLASLYQLQQNKILTAGYISLPKNKELINLLRLQLCNFNFDACEAYKDVDPLVDTNIAHFFLKPFTRSIIFKNHAKICELYPEQLHPHFFYLHVGTEIGRVEIPAWIAADQTHVDLISRILIDQSIKGRGYPVALAEAHEQAVIKGPDREFFYQLINKIGFERNQQVHMSQKSIKKRGLSI